ncbi:hypothetical protein GCM10020229_83300 [Kitasatospora albolonga]
MSRASAASSSTSRTSKARAGLVIIKVSVGCFGGSVVDARPAPPGALAGEAAGRAELRVAGPSPDGGGGGPALQPFGGPLDLLQDVQQAQRGRRGPGRRGVRQQLEREAARQPVHRGLRDRRGLLRGGPEQEVLARHGATLGRLPDPRQQALS